MWIRKEENRFERNGGDLAARLLPELEMLIIYYPDLGEPTAAVRATNETEALNILGEEWEGWIMAKTNQNNIAPGTQPDLQTDPTVDKKGCCGSGDGKDKGCCKGKKSCGK